MKHECLEQQVKELQFTLSKFSHEIRNPIALISSELQLLLASHPEIENFPEWTDIQENIEYIKDLLQELSDFNNAKKIKPEPTDLTAYLHTIASSVSPTMNYLGICFEEKISSALPTCSIDRIKLRQALLNLLRNAQESILHTNGKIIFSATVTCDGKISISVQDNGCGIDSDRQEDIFSPFVTYKKDGTGLGLAITRQIVQAHHGDLTVHSLSGEGSKFVILLDGKE